ncbi:MAG TPA: phosphate/phosphite/phosphonate ABC transporter substrate-binding protein [Acidimicrobiales bacterium]
MRVVPLRPILAVFGAAVMVATAAACSSDDTETRTATEVEAASATPAAPDQPEEEAESIEKLRIAVIGEGTDSTLADRLKPLNDALSEATGLPVDLVEVADGNGLVEALHAGRVDVASLSGFILTFARQLADVEIIAATAGSTDVSTIVVPKDSPVTNLDELRGKSIALGDPNSAGSGVQPRALLLDHGIDPERDLDVTYTGGYDTALLAAYNGTVDAAATRPFVMQLFAQNGAFPEDAFRIIATSEPLPLGLAIVGREGLPPSIIEKLRTFFLSAEGLSVFQAVFPLADKTFVPDAEVLGYFERIIEELGIELSSIE